MDIILGTLSVLIIGAVFFIPIPKTPHEKKARAQKTPWESLGQRDKKDIY